MDHWLDVVEGLKVLMVWRSAEHGAPSLFSGYPSYLAAGPDVAASGVDQKDATSAAGLVAKSSIDAAGVAGGERMKGRLGVALEGTVAEELGNTFVCSAVIETLARHTFCAGHVRKEMQQRLESLIVEYGRLGDTGASSARLP